MIVERGNDGRYSASGNGPKRPIAVDGATRAESLTNYARAYSDQTTELRDENPEAVKYLTDFPEVMPEGNWEQAYREMCPEQYARQEAATALAEQNNMDSLSDSEREYIYGDMG